MLIYIYDGFCYLYDVRFQKSVGKNFSFQVQGHFKVKYAEFHEIHVYWALSVIT